MADTKAVLERTARTAPPAGYELTDLHDRRVRRVTAARRRSATLGLVLVAALSVSSWTVLRSASTSPVAATDGGLPAATEPPPSAAPGEYYYLQLWTPHAERCGDGTTEWDCRYSHARVRVWWSPDESGRVVGVESDETYAPGDFPRDTVTTGLPTDVDELREALFARAAPDGTSPQPEVTVAPGQDGRDASVERSIVDLLEMWNTTPALRVALVEVLAGMPGVDVSTDAVDPAGRPAYELTVTTSGGPTVHHLFVDPSTHDLLAHTENGMNGDGFGGAVIVETAGIADSTRAEPTFSAIQTPGELPSAEDVLPSPPTFVERCTQGGPDLRLTVSNGHLSTRCFVLETGSPWTLTVKIDEPGVTMRLGLLKWSTGDRVVAGEAVVVGPGETTYSFEGIDMGRYRVVNLERPRSVIGELRAV